MLRVLVVCMVLVCSMVCSTPRQAGAGAVPDTLMWTMPTMLSMGCAPDGSPPARDAITVAVLHMRGQYPLYYRGIEDDPQGWTALTAWCRPDTLGTVTAPPGTRCRFLVAPGEYAVVPVGRSRPSCWSTIVIAR